MEAGRFAHPICNKQPKGVFIMNRQTRQIRLNLTPSVISKATRISERLGQNISKTVGAIIEATYDEAITARIQKHERTSDH
jgi:hypothetical protein